MYWLLVLLILSGQVFAQPWQWELYQGDYYNPTGFATFTPYPTECVVGDFNGDGRGETVGYHGADFLVVSKEIGAFHWTVDTSSSPPGWENIVDAVDLDEDGADEILEIGSTGVHAWKAVSSDPWTWQSREDLVEGFNYPEGTSGAVYGDFDQDGLINGFFMLGGWTPIFELWERSSGGSWVVDTTFGNPYNVSQGALAGDFDHDGDEDVAITPMLTDVPPFGGFGESTPQGIVWHLFTDYWPLVEFPGPTGGDVDGDGEWEGLFQYEGFPGHTLVETQADPTYFVQTTERRYLGSLPGPVFGNFRVNGETLVGAIRNWTWGAPFYTNNSFVCMAQTDSGWQDFYSGFYSSWGPYGGYQCMEGNRADLNGDGLDDIFASLVDGGYSWGIWKNHGTVDQDSFSIMYQHNVYFTHRFLSNPDTSFGFPQIGDITGDGRAELAVISEVPEAVFYVYIFEMVGEIEDTTFVLHREWSEGLPITFRRIRLADIDNDGLAELIGRDQNNVWHAYFRRNGTWEEYENILPPVTSDEISFADANNDGDLDLFTPTQLYYSLSPSIGRRPEAAASIREFALSAHPNPFNGTTTISYDVPRAGKVELTVYNLLGEKVEELVSGTLPAGRYSAVWRPQVSSGIYFARLEAGASRMIKKVVYLR